ncbi:MAG: hypothetical protein AB1578_12620 [Thermodesulfobacteriota bacterium]
MTGGLLPCPSCGAALPWTAWNAGGASACPSCRRPVEVIAFPALLRGPEESRPGEILLAADQASCFFHPGKAAALACEGCGRFLCSLCDLSLGDEHLCAACLEAGRGVAAGTRPAPGRTLWDGVALSLAVFPLALWFVTFATAPAAVYLGIRHWNDARRSPVPRTRLRNVLAILIGSAQLAGWAAALYTWLT